MPGQCFVAGTPVAVADGVRPIEEIRAGDEVLSSDPETGETVIGSVSSTFLTPNRQVLDLFIQDDPEPIRATPGHPFLTLDHGWANVEWLMPGEPLIGPDGLARIVDHVDLVARRETVYNFEVDVSHTYFVGKSRVLVHNPIKPVEKGLPGEHAVEPLGKNGAIIVTDMDFAHLQMAKRYSAAFGVPVYFWFNVDPNSPMPPNDLMKGGRIYEEGPPPDFTLRPKEGASRPLEGFSPTALDGKDNLFIIGHGSPNNVGWGPKGNMDGKGFADLLAAAGYNPKAVSSNADIVALSCNFCTKAPDKKKPRSPSVQFSDDKPSGSGPSMGDQLASAFGIPVTGHAAQAPYRDKEGNVNKIPYYDPITKTTKMGTPGANTSYNYPAGMAFGRGPGGERILRPKPEGVPAVLEKKTVTGKDAEGKPVPKTVYVWTADTMLDSLGAYETVCKSP
jgi:hypothetical protein